MHGPLKQIKLQESKKSAAVSIKSSIQFTASPVIKQHFLTGKIMLYKTHPSADLLKGLQSTGVIWVWGEVHPGQVASSSQGHIFWQTTIYAHSQKQFRTSCLPTVDVCLQGVGGSQAPWEKGQKAREHDLGPCGYNVTMQLYIQDHMYSKWA